LNRKITGAINGAVAAASYGMNPLFALPMYAAGVGVNSVLFYRYAIAVVLYGFWIKLFKKDSLKITLKEFFPLLFLGLFFSASSLTLFMAFHYIEAGIACTILFVYPLFVAVIMALFFKEKVTKTTIAAILLTFVCCKPEILHRASNNRQALFMALYLWVGTFSYYYFA